MQGRAKMSPCCGDRIISSGPADTTLFINFPSSHLARHSSQHPLLISFGFRNTPLLSSLYLLSSFSWLSLSPSLILTWSPFMLGILFSRHQSERLRAPKTVNTFVRVACDSVCVRSVICEPVHLSLSLAQRRGGLACPITRRQSL